ncbi:MAG: hypothetical protein V4792_07735 [Pseudomonadota bacterium]
MLRLSRPLTLLLLWLAIALLPMRGWAAAVMPVAMASEALGVTLPAPAGAAEPAAAMPCHGASDEAGPSNGSACSHCEACHGATALLACVSERVVVEPGARPRLEPSPGVERPVQSGPDRPPRSQRA